MKNSPRPLWAPWRVAFIRGKKSPGCFLCHHEQPGTTPEDSLIIARYSECFVILNRYPYNSGHLLIAPYVHCGDLALLPPSTAHQIMDVCSEMKRLLDSAMKPAGYNIGFNLGSAAGAGVAEHLHMHIVPRWVGDANFMPVIGDTRVVPEALEDTAKFLRAKIVESASR